MNDIYDKPWPPMATPFTATLTGWTLQHDQQFTECTALTLMQLKCEFKHLGMRRLANMH